MEIISGEGGTGEGEVNFCWTTKEGLFLSPIYILSPTQSPRNDIWY